MRLHVGLPAQDLEQTDPVDRSGGARDPDDEALQRRNLLRNTSSRVFSYSTSHSRLPSGIGRE